MFRPIDPTRLPDELRRMHRLNEALGVEPIKKTRLFPTAKAWLVDACHQDLPHDSRVIERVRTWLKE